MKTNNQPIISVIMGIYNCAQTLADAIKCIQNQTFSNWELILCDDGSTDETYAIAMQYAKADTRILLLKNNCNKGLNYTLNHCLKYARGKYIARMDGDDICALDRFEKQINILNQNSNIALVSSGMYYFDEEGRWGKSIPISFPNNNDFIHGTPFAHAPCMIRSEVMKAVGGYSESKWLLRVEDVHLWMKIYQLGYKGMNILEPLYEMRDDRNAYARRRFRFRVNEAYVKWLTYRNLHISLKYYPFILRPIFVGLLPNKIYDYLHKKKLNQ